MQYHETDPKMDEWHLWLLWSKLEQKQKPVWPSNNQIFKNLKRNNTTTQDKKTVGKANKIDWMFETQRKLWQHTYQCE